MGGTKKTHKTGTMIVAMPFPCASPKKKSLSITPPRKIKPAKGKNADKGGLDKVAQISC